MRNSLLIGKGGRVLDVIDWTDAINLTYVRDGGNAVFVLDFYKDEYVRSAHDVFPLPSVLMLNGNRDKYPNSDKLTLTRKNIFMRDGSICQWCGKSLSDKNGTIDHVFAKRHGGTNTWRNVVACCFDCNNEKGDMTVKQYTKKTGKKLKRKPFVPHRGFLYKNYLNKEGYEGWIPYLSKFVD